MTNSSPYPKDCLLFAPMEGITDAPYRRAVMKLFPEWTKFATDFLRLPTEGHYPLSKYIHHLGEDILKDKRKRERTTFQILTTTRANTLEGLQVIKSLGIRHLDLNLGCPSKKVNSHGGGAFLMSNLKDLEEVVSTIRNSFPHHFTVKIRVGYRDDTHFLEALRLFEDSGVDAITLHARTRDQLYKGVANWDYIAQAVEAVNIPVIANGDVWTLQDLKRMKTYTGCHGVMLARGAMKTPWFAKAYNLVEAGLLENSAASLLEFRKSWLPVYFRELEEQYRLVGRDDFIILKRFKAVGRYLFDDFPNGDQTKRPFLRSKSLEDFYKLLEELCDLKFKDSTAHLPLFKQEVKALT